MILIPILTQFDWSMDLPPVSDGLKCSIMEPGVQFVIDFGLVLMQRLPAGQRHTNTFLYSL